MPLRVADLNLAAGCLFLVTRTGACSILLLSDRGPSRRSLLDTHTPTHPRSSPLITLCWLLLSYPPSPRPLGVCKFLSLSLSRKEAGKTARQLLAMQTLAGPKRDGSFWRSRLARRQCSVGRALLLLAACCCLEPGGEPRPPSAGFVVMEKRKRRCV